MVNKRNCLIYFTSQTLIMMIIIIKQILTYRVINDAIDLYRHFQRVSDECMHVGECSAHDA